MSFEAAVHAKAIELDHLALDMCATAGSGHPTSALSLGHITTVLLYHAMRWLPDHPRYPTSDRLVLSAGHAVPIVYAACADLGVAFGQDPATYRAMTREDAMTLRAVDSPIEGHPNPMEGFPFFDAATGSLGQGLSVAIGLGIAAEADDTDRRIYCIIGDGESREGQIWEAVDMIADRGLRNVLPIFNCNGYGQADAVSDQQSPETIARKLEAFGLTVVTIDGHDPAAIRQAFDQFRALSNDDRPMAVVAKTVKGWGAASIQGGGWHGKPAAGDRLQQAHEELDAMRLGLTSALAGDELKIYPPKEWKAPTAAPTERPSFSAAMRTHDMGTLLQTGRMATRRAYGLALRVLGKTDPSVWALDADVRNSTFAEWFATDRSLGDRFVECRIAEQNMVSVAAGLAAAGKIPFASTFAKFMTRAYDQIEMAINSGANVKLVGSHAGISLAADGPSQMSLPDVAWFRSLATMRNQRGVPGCFLLQPADAFAAYALTMAMADHPGACYMRTLRPETEFLYDDRTEFALGRFEVLHRGRDLLIVSSGYMVHECNKVLDQLDRIGIDATLVDLYSIPFDAEALLDLANENDGKVLVVEDNYGASIGSAVADVCTESGDGFTINQMFVQRIPKSARTEEEILKYCGLHHNDIVRAAASMIGVQV